MEMDNEQVKLWSDNPPDTEFPDWPEQMRLLSEIGDLGTQGLSFEELIATVYGHVNQLMDAYQFAVGLYNEKEGMIHFIGMIENKRHIPNTRVKASDKSRFATWCIQNESEIFINDIEADYRKYVETIPVPIAGLTPSAALYVPLHLKGKLAGLITVRTIHKNVYQKHHLYILKTLGTFMLNALSLTQEQDKPLVNSGITDKQWNWGKVEQLSVPSRKLLDQLTEREKDVLKLMSTGLPNKEIAEKLFVSPGTIKTHTLNIYIKMDVSNRTSAILKAIELKWLV